MNDVNQLRQLYYYTSVSVMKSVLTEGSIWATNILYMNDSEEYKNGLKEIEPLLKQCLGIEQRDGKEEKEVKKVVQKQIASPDTNCYSISFSGQADLLSQWSMYAKESGVNLQFAFDDLQKCDADEKMTYWCYNYNMSDEARYLRLSPSAPQPVFYFTKETMQSRCSDDDISKIEADIKENLMKDSSIISITDKKERVLNDRWKDNLHRHVAQIKRYEFNAEDEYRLVFKITNHETHCPVNYRLDQGVLKPYIRVQCEWGNSDDEKVRTKEALTASSWPIVAITVGPGHNQQVVFESIKHFLDYGNILTLPKWLIIHNCQTYVDAISRAANNIGDNLNMSINESKKHFANVDLDLEMYKNMVKRVEEEAFLENNSEINEFMNYNYYSNSGIILRKSKIPYIF